MMRSYNARIDSNGQVHLLEPAHLHGPCKAVVTVLEPTTEETDGALLKFAESSLSNDWERPEEDEAWAHLQPDR
jgi:hypothetical protein